MSDDAADARLDARGLTCPLPVLRASKMLKTLGNGALLAIMATDPASMRDFASFCTQTGHELVRSWEDADGVFHYLVRKAPASSDTSSR